MNNLKNHLILISTVALIISDFVYSDHSCKTALNGAGFSHDGEVNMMKLNEISKNSELYTQRSEKHELAWLNKYKYYLSTFEMNTSCCGMKLPITNNQGKNENPLGIYEFCCIETLKEIGFNENVNYNLFNLIYRIPKSYTLANLNSLDFDIEEYAAHLYPGRPSLRDVANYAEQTGNISENLLNESYSNPVVQRSGRGKSIINSNIIMYNNDYTNNIIQVLEEANSLERNSQKYTNPPRIYNTLHSKPNFFPKNYSGRNQVVLDDKISSIIKDFEYNTNSEIVQDSQKYTNPPRIYNTLHSKPNFFQENYSERNQVELDDKISSIIKDVEYDTNSEINKIAAVNDSVAHDEIVQDFTKDINQPRKYLTPLPSLISENHPYQLSFNQISSINKYDAKSSVVNDVIKRAEIDNRIIYGITEYCIMRYYNTTE